MIQEHFPGFRHNDLKTNNIFCTFTYDHLNFDNYEPVIHDCIIYRFKNKYYQIPDIGIVFIFGDFGLSEIINRTNPIYNSSITRQLEINYGLYKEQNEYYDLHYFFNTLLHNISYFEYNKHFKHLFDILEQTIRTFIVPEEVADNINKPDRHRLIERGYKFTTAGQLLEYLPLFNDFRKELDGLQIECQQKWNMIDTFIS